MHLTNKKQLEANHNSFLRLIKQVHSWCVQAIKWIGVSGLLLSLFLLAPVAYAEVNIGGLSIDFVNQDPGSSADNANQSNESASGAANTADTSTTVDTEQAMATPLKILLLVTLLSLVPAFLVVVTSFTRIIIVLSMLRHAFGMPSTPPNSILISLALFLTLFSMWPVWEQIQTDAVQPYIENQLDDAQAVSAALNPLRDFMIRQTSEVDIELVLDLTGQAVPNTASDISTMHLIPAFMLSELRTAFEIGFVIFLPFLLVDLLVASILMSLGMIMVPPLTISLPIKVLMFVLIGGWNLIADALVRSFI